jgi:hypothetical protein
MCVAQLAGARVSAGVDPEYRVKAEFIERFTQFVSWPNEAFATQNAPFVLCVAGQNPFGDYLDELIKARTFNLRRGQLRVIRIPGDLDGCHVLFIAASERGRLGALVSNAARKPILTVGDSSGYGRAGVLVNFYIHERNVRFEINLSAVKLSGLKFNSKLLKLARIVEPGVSR